MFDIHGLNWNIELVSCDDPILYDYINEVQSIATTDYITKCIYIADDLDDDLLLKVIKHELYHCYEFSGIGYDFDIMSEELIAYFISEYGEELLDLAREIFEEIKQ